jgi:hypothetical protein
MNKEVHSPPTDCSVLISSADSVVTPSTNVSSVYRHATSAHEDNFLWAKVISSKAHAETTNIAKHMGKREELEKGWLCWRK